MPKDQAPIKDQISEVDQTKIERILVGQVVGVFGIKGWVKIKSFTQPEENIVNYRPWWLKTKHGLKCFEPDEYKLRSQGLIVHFKDYDNREATDSLIKAKIEIEQKLLPQLGVGDYYWHQLIGLSVISVHPSALSGSVESGYILGRVSKMLETGANDVLVVQGDEASLDLKERLIPYVPDQYVIDIDIDLGVIRVNWDPEF